MGFGTDQQIGNRTGLADLFRGNIGAPQQLGTAQQPNQLFTLLQSLLGGQGAQPPQGFGGPSPMVGGTPLSAVTAQPPQGFGGRPGNITPGAGQITPIGLGQPGQQLDVMPRGFGNTPGMGQITNPFGNLINQRAFR